MPSTANRIRNRARRAATGGLLAAALLLAASPAAALGIADTLPLAFQPEGGGMGLVESGHPAGWDVASSGLAPAWSIGFGTTAGFSLTQDLGPVHSNPQEDGDTPSAADPFIADSSWTLTNETGGDLQDVVLAFVMPNHAAYANDVQVALDGNLVQLLEYTGGGGALTFAAVWIGDLAAGETSDAFTVRYIVTGDLVTEVDGSHTEYVMPPLSLAVFTNVPEPGAALLVGSGLALLGVGARRR